MIRIALTMLLCLPFALPLRAGILADGTRLIYSAQSREKTLMLANTNRYPVIVQSWVDDGEGNPELARAPFVVLPAVFRLAPGERQAIRIIYNQEPLPPDRESVFWLNLYEIPPVTRAQEDSARVMLAMNTQLKLFWRPAGLDAALDKAVEKLRFRLVRSGAGWAIECDNPTPLNVSFTSLRLTSGAAAEPEMDMMARAFSTRRYALSGPPDGARQIRFYYLDENGAAKTGTAAIALATPSSTP